MKGIFTTPASITTSAMAWDRILRPDGRPLHRPGLLGQAVDLTRNTAIVEFNDVPALEEALARCDVACVITEPVLTNSAMVLPAPGFHEALRRLTRETGTLRYRVGRISFHVPTDDVPPDQVPAHHVPPDHVPAAGYPTPRPPRHR